MRIFKGENGRQFRRVSRWIKVNYKTVTSRHSLADYADGDSLAYFRHGGREYALGQFMRLTAPEFFENEDGKKSFLSGYDCTQYYKPYLIEIDDGGEYVRLFEEVAQ